MMLTGERLAQFTARVLSDAMAEATSGYWIRRGRTFLDAMPRPGDYNGRATAEQLEVARERCRVSARVCFARATVEGPGQPVPDEVWDVLAERVA